MDVRAVRPAGGYRFDERTFQIFLLEYLNTNARGAFPRLPISAPIPSTRYWKASISKRALIESASAPTSSFFYDGAMIRNTLSSIALPDAHHGYRRVQALIESYFIRSWFGLLKPINAAIYSSFRANCMTD